MYDNEPAKVRADILAYMAYLLRGGEDEEVEENSCERATGRTDVEQHVIDFFNPDAL
jgi:hypothetical protein